MGEAVKKYSVLIVDDDSASIMTLTHILSSEYTVYAVKSGRQAVQAAEMHLPDVILLDIVMPDIDGYAVLAALKSSEQTKEIPVIYVTGLNTAGSEEKGLQLGAADYIIKPFSPAIVLRRIESQIKMLEQARAAEYNATNYKLVCEAMHIALWRMEARTPVVEQGAEDVNIWIWSQEFRHMLGFSDENDFPDTLESFMSRLHPEDVEGALAAFVAHFNDRTGQTPYDIEYRLRHKNGEYRYFDGFGTALRDPEGYPIRVSGAIRDVTEKKHLEETLDRQNNLLYAVNHAAGVLLTAEDEDTLREALLEGMGIIGRGVDADCVELWRNEWIDGKLYATIRHYWFSDQNRRATTIADFPSFPYSDTANWENRLAQGECIHGPIFGLPPEDQEFANSFGLKSLLVIPMFMKNRLWGMCCIDDYSKYRSFSEDEINILRSVVNMMASAMRRQALDEELHSALEQATAASKAKGDFLSHMSHEMRTPMNAIIGMTAIGRKAADMEGKDHAFGKIGDASSHLLGVINDVLDISKIEANKLELAPVEYDFEKMLHKVLTVVNFRVEEKRQTLSVSIDPGLPRYIVGDDQRLAQVITNLMANAVKFTPEGGEIRLAVSVDWAANGDCELCVEVSDSGIGISAEQQEKLFTAFEQAESGTSREYGGTGLGLVISKRIIELMGGGIRVESELGKGSRFIFTVKARCGPKSRDSGGVCIPCEADRDKGGAEETPGTFAGRRMLLAEDMEINREILIALLEDTGILIECAENGREALEMIEANPGKYDIV